jgi:hypothetical protein
MVVHHETFHDVLIDHTMRPMIGDKWTRWHILKPLVEDLKTLWEVIINVWDAGPFRVKATFSIIAILLWTMHDLPAYGTIISYIIKGSL